MNQRVALLFSGQGAQNVGMGSDLKGAYPEAREVFEMADDILKFPLTSIMFSGPEELLLETVNSQLALYVHGIAVLSVLRARIDLNVVCGAGLSLGEYTTLTAAGVLSFDQGLPLVQTRGALMNEACLLSQGGMAAVVGLSPEVVEEGVSSLGDIWVANYNAPSQIVISGVKEKVTEAIEVFKSLGAKKVVPLNVFGAFHSPLMVTAEEALVPFLQEARLETGQFKLVSNVTGKFCRDLEEHRALLLKQITSPTLWFQGCLEMAKECDVFLEIGCGKVLAGLNRLSGISQPTISIGSVETIEKFLEKSE